MTDLHPNARRVADAARDLGLDIDVRTFPEGTKTAADAAAAIGVEVGQVAIVSLVIPLLIGADWLIARMRGAPQDRTAALVYAISGIIACLGCYWFLERTVLGA